METENINEQGEKKPKRPRIGAQPAAEASGRQARYDSYRPSHDEDGANGMPHERNTYPRRAPFQPREDGNNGGYQPRYNNRYGNRDDRQNAREATRTNTPAATTTTTATRKATPTT